MYRFIIFLLFTLFFSLKCILPLGYYYSENWDVANENLFHCVYTPDNLNFENGDIVVYLIKDRLVESLIDEFDLIDQREDKINIKLKMENIYKHRKSKSIWFLVEDYGSLLIKNDFKYILSNNVHSKDIIEYKVGYETKNSFGLFIYGDKKPKRATFTRIIYNDDNSSRIKLFNSKVGILKRTLLRFEKNEVSINDMNLNIYLNGKLTNTFKRRERCKDFSSEK
jgi:hypothetical protein